MPTELWARIETFRQDEHLSNTAEAVRVLLWRIFAEMDCEQEERGDE